MKCLCALATSLLALALTPAHSQTYPTHPNKLVNGFADLGGEARGGSPEEMRSYIEGEIDKWKRLIDSRKIEKQ